MERFPVHLKPPKEVPFKVPTYRDGEHLKLLITGSHLPIYVTMASTRQGARSGVEADRGTFVPVPTEKATAYEDMYLDVAPDAMRAVTEGSTVYANIWSYDPVTGERESWANGEIIKGAAIRNDDFVPPSLSAPMIATQAKADAQNDEDGTYTVIITPPTANGYPGPSVSLTALRLDGADVLELLDGWTLDVEQLDKVRSVSATFAAISPRGSAQSLVEIDVPALPKPIAAGALPDLELEEGTGVVEFDLASDFVGYRLTYALRSERPGVSLDTETGQGGIDTAVTGTLDGTSVVGEASNVSGTATTAFSLSVRPPQAASLNPTASRNAVDPRLVDFDFEPVHSGYLAYLYVGREGEGSFAEAREQAEGGTTTGMFPFATHVLLYTVDRDDLTVPVSKALVASLDEYDPTVAGANLSAGRNGTNPGQVDLTNGLGHEALPPGWSIGMYIGDLPEGDPAFVTTVNEGETVTPEKEFPDADYVVGILFDEASAVVDREVVTRLTAVGEGGGAAVTITQTHAPTISRATEGQTARSRYNAGAYEASDGSTVDVDPQMVVNGVEVADGYVLTAGDELAVRETATVGDAVPFVRESVAVTVGERITTITSFADWEAFADEAATTTEDRPFVYDRNSMKADSGPTEPVGGWKIPGEHSEPGVIYDSTRRLVTVDAGFTGKLKDWKFENTGVQYYRRPDLVENCLYVLNNETPGPDLGINAINGVQGSGDVEGGLYFKKCAYIRENRVLGGPDFFQSKRESGVLHFENCYMDGLWSDIAPLDTGVGGRNNFFISRAFDDWPYWDAETTYNKGDAFINAEGVLYVTEQDGTVGVPPPFKKENDNQTVYTLRDPHSDGFQGKTPSYSIKTDPSKLRLEYSILLFDGGPDEPQVSFYWDQFPNTNDGDTFPTEHFFRCGLIGRAGDDNPRINIEGRYNLDTATPIFEECWITPDKDGEYVQFANPAKGDTLLWVNNRNSITGEFAGVPAGATDDTTLRLEGREDVDGFARLTFNRTPIIVSTEGITLSGSSTLVVDKAVVERILARAIRDVADNAYEIDIEIGGGGTVVVEPPEGETDPDPTPEPSLPSRLGIGFWSQSQTAFMLHTSGKTDIAPPALQNDVRMTVYMDENGTNGTAGNPDIRVNDVTQAALDSDLINPAMGAFGEFMAFLFPGVHIDAVDFATVGTGFEIQMDDRYDDILWSDKQTMIDRVEADGGQIDLNLWSWMGDDANSVMNGSYFSAQFPLFTGQRSTGEPITIGQPNADSAYDRNIDHIIYDVSAPVDQLGRGAFAHDVSLNFVGWPTFNDDDTGAPEDLNYTDNADYSFGGYDSKLDRPGRDQVYRFLNDPAFENVRGWHGPSAHIVDMGYGTHPRTDVADGQVLYMWAFAITAARRLGNMRCRNMVIHEVTKASDGSWWRLHVRDSEGNALDPDDDTLTSLRRLRGLPAPDPLPPHWQECMGVEIVRADGTRRPVYRLDAGADYPDSHKGTITFDGDAMLVEPLVPFEDGDYPEFLRGDASVMLQEPRDIDALVYQDVPLVHVASLYQESATYPCPGIAVEPQPPVEVLKGERTGGGKLAYPIPAPLGSSPGSTPDPDPEPTPGESWTATGGAGVITVASTGDTMPSPTATGGAGNITIKE